VNTWKVILATMVIFGAGVVTGGLLVRNAGRTEVPRPISQQAANRPFLPGVAGLVRVEFLRRAERELNLTRDQREQVDKIIKDSQERTKKLMEPVTPKVREELQQTKDQFLALLTPEQRGRFEELLKQQQRQQQQQQQRMREQHRPPMNSSLPSPNAEPLNR
jgi:Spy/CpxP family protein refolding chaperone